MIDTSILWLGIILVIPTVIMIFLFVLVIVKITQPIHDIELLSRLQELQSDLDAAVSALNELHVTLDKITEVPKNKNDSNA